MAPYYVQSTVDDPATFPYHSSVSAIWEKKWQKPASMGIYPFVDGKEEDFRAAFSTLVKASDDNYSIFYNPDDYAKPFFSVAESLVTRAKSAEAGGEIEQARDLYFRAAAVYRISRFPINRSPLSQKAWELGKETYMAGARYLSPPIQEILIPHKHALPESGEAADSVIPVYLRIPEGEKPADGWPVLLFICGLDAYRTDHTERISEHVRRGFACISVEIPGTGDSPAARNDPTSPDRQWSSVLDWIEQVKGSYGFNPARIVARGVSTGGYYAMRIAHTHHDRLYAVVAQGGGSHHMFDEEWIQAQNHMEYPFALANALAYKFGYESVEQYTADKPRGKFSLVENGIFDGPCARLLLINGMEDSIFPIEDSMLALRHGSVKDARFFDGKAHMGNPGAEEVLYEWIDEVMKK
ncbi:alpha/beta-hydrolase [Thozetella sp. PMI_491]|nr:alpha/beta-hydrolase [Thozetella sp. PMI_491]